MNTKRILIAAGAALALGTLIGPVVLHAQDDDSDGIHDQLRIMTRILEASIGKDSLDRRLNLSVFDSKIRTEYIPTVGAIFTIPISFPLHPSEAEKGNGTEDVVEEDLWEHFSSASENTARAAAPAVPTIPPVPPIEPLATIDIEINVEEEGRDEQAVLRLLKRAERARTQALENLRVSYPYQISQGEGKRYDPVKVSTLTHTIIETIAQYGHRLKSLKNSERILVVIEAPGMHDPGRRVEVSTRVEQTRNRSTQAPRTTEEKIENGVAALLEERRKLDEAAWARQEAERRANREFIDMRTRMGYGNRMYLSRGEKHYDHRVLAFKKSDLQQERSYDSIKGKVETTDY